MSRLMVYDPLTLKVIGLRVFAFKSESLLRQGRPFTGAAGRRLLNFEYVLLKLFDYNIRDYYDQSKPVVR